MRNVARTTLLMTLMLAAHLSACSHSEPSPPKEIKTSPAPATTSTPALQAAERQAREMASAMLRSDYQTITRSTYPRVVQLNGGADRMEQMMREGSAKMRADGVTFHDVSVRRATWSDLTGRRWYAIIPETVTMRTPKSLLVQESYLLGISDDRGATWSFIDGAGLNEQNLKAVLPDAPASLRLPPKQPTRQQPLPRGR